jgi:hypothetical protein
MRRARALARRLVALAPALLGAGCVSYDSGWLAAAAVERLPLAATVVEEEVEGRSCAFAEGGFPRALDDALAKAPGANALEGASVRFERLCMIVRGRAVRVGPR